jgi:hypothetical protein
MRHERETLRQMLQAAQSQDFGTCKPCCGGLPATIIPRHHHDNDDLSIVDVLSQFWDARKRTALPSKKTIMIETMLWSK